MDTRWIFQISVSFCVFLCHSALETGWDFWVFVQFQAGLARFQGRFFRELCRSVPFISMLRQSRAVVRSPDGRGTVASKHYGKASLPGLERGWCHGWVLCCWWYGINSGITGGGLAHGPSFGTFPTTFCRLVGGSKESKQDRRD